LQRFYRREGHCRVQANRKESGLSLGTWVSRQRGQKERLAPDRLKRLNDLGFSWDPIAEHWEQGFVALQKFQKREGHCRVPKDHEEDGLNLGNWVHVRRIGKEELTPDRLEQLNGLGFSWDPVAEDWEQNCAALQKFRKREGHCRVSARHEEDGLKTGKWVGTQRGRKEELTPERLKQLDALGFCWDPAAEDWEQNLAALQKFKKREGHCRVPAGHEEDGQNLGTWVSARRKCKEELTSDRLMRLNALGFSWDPIAEDWERNFAALQRFQKREGHCRVPKSHEEDGINLATWVYVQRGRKEELTPDQLIRLNALRFSWDPLAERWEQDFAALQTFHRREGHCVVPRGHIEDGRNLSIWVCVQRRVKNGLTPDQLRRLNSLGFVWDALAERWDQIFALLQTFQKREGHCRAPSSHEEDGVNLGKWAGYQRANREELTPDQLRRLNSLGFSWDPKGVRN
jgi:hypothetical protein